MSKRKQIGVAYSGGNTPHGGLGPFSVLGDAVDLRYTRPDKVDAIVLWGGSDINPKYYNEEPHPMNHYSPGSVRDEQEYYYQRVAIDSGIPLIGVCRGAQFLCAMAGGKLVQHVNGHHGDHDVTVIDGDKEVKGLSTSSCHHQMLWPWDLPEGSFKLLGWSGNRSTKYEGANNTKFEQPPVDIEAMLFPNIKAFGVQGHPEWMHDSDPYVQWTLKQCRHLLGIDE